VLRRSIIFFINNFFYHNFFIIILTKAKSSLVHRLLLLGRLGDHFHIPTGREVLRVAEHELLDYLQLVGTLVQDLELLEEWGYALGQRAPQVLVQGCAELSARQEEERLLARHVGARILFGVLSVEVDLFLQVVS